MYEFSSPLLKKYSEENDTVQMHLHLFSLQYKVYKNLNRENELLDFIQRTGAVSPDFIRSWEIIEKEGVESAAGCREDFQPVFEGNRRQFAI